MFHLHLPANDSHIIYGSWLHFLPIGPIELKKTSVYIFKKKLKLFPAYGLPIVNSRKSTTNWQKTIIMNPKVFLEKKPTALTPTSVGTWKESLIFWFFLPRCRSYQSVYLDLPWLCVKLCAFKHHLPKKPTKKANTKTQTPGRSVDSLCRFRYRRIISLNKWVINL